MTFGERMRELREEKDVTQKKVAEVLRVSPRMVSFYENGTHFLSDEQQLRRLADYFGVTSDYLLGISNVRSAARLQSLCQMFERLTETNRNITLEFMAFLLTRQQRKEREKDESERTNG